MVDIYKELQSLKDEFNEKYVSVFDLITHLQNTNENLSKEDVIDWIFIKLRKFNNFQEFFSYDDFNWVNEANNFVLENGIPVYKKRDDGVVCIYDTSTPNLFFEFLIYAKNTKRSLSALEFDMDEWGFKKARAKDLLLNRQMIEKEIGEKIGCVKDDGIFERLNAIQLQTKLKRAEDKIKILEEQIVKLQAEEQNANKGVLHINQNEPKDNQNYSPIERETHLQIIATLSFELSKTAQKYKRGNDKINFSAIAKMLEEHSDSFENRRTAEAYRKRIVEAVNSFNGAD